MACNLVVRFLGVWVLILIGCLELFSQVAATSVASGNWNAPATWSCNCIPSSSNGTITISAGHTVTVNTAVTADEIVVAAGTPGGVLNITSGGVLTVANGAGSDVTNSGSITTSTSSALVFNSGSEYNHSRTGGGIPISTWSSGSICRITGWTTTATSADLTAFRNSLNQSFHHFTWESAQSSNVEFNGFLKTVNGDLTISRTGSLINNASNTKVVFGLNGIPTATGSLIVKGNFIVTGNSQVTINTSGTYTMTVEGNVSLSSDNVGNLNPYWITNTNGTTNLNVLGDFTLTKGVLDLNVVNGNSSINVGKNFVFSGGTITRSASQGQGIINFYNGGTHTYTRTAGLFTSQPITFQVSSGNILDLDSYTIGNASGSGAFLNSGTVVVGSTNATGAISGNILPVSRTFNSGSTIIYRSGFSQFMGSDQPSAPDVNTVIDNTSGVFLASNAAVGNLTLTDGNLTVGSNTLTINGNVTPNNSFIEVTNGSSLEIAGSGPFGTIPLTGSNTLNNLTINRSGGSATLPYNLTVAGTFSQFAGTLNLNNHTLTVEGDYVGIGDLDGTSSSSLVINGAGSLPDEVFMSGIFNTITLNRADASLITSSAFEVTNLNLTAGNFENTTAMSMTDGGLITVVAGTLLAAPDCQGTYDVVYNNVDEITTTAELQSDPKVDDVTLNGGATVIVGGNSSITGDLNIASGGLNAGVNTISLGGNLIVNASSNFSSSSINFNGVTSISGSNIPEFGSVAVSNGATLNVPTSMQIAGDAAFHAASTVNASNTTITLTGAGSQNVSGGGKSVHNLTLNKSVGTSVTLTSNLSMTGRMSISSFNTTFNSAGFLTLVSTSDGNADNASIGPLLNGAAVNGNVNVQRYMSSEGRIYRYLSSPVSNAPVSDLQDDFPVTGSFPQSSICSGCAAAASLFYYNAATAAYVAYPTTSNAQTLEVGRGYAGFVRQNILPGAVTVDLTGSINQGDIPLPVAHNASVAESWNLVGNPYPASIDWDTPSGWTKQNISGSIAVRDNGAVEKGHVYWNGTIGDIEEGVIAAGQAFWVRTTGATPQLTVHEDAKSTSTGAFFREAELNYMKIKIAKGNYTDQSYFQIIKGAAHGLDDFDAPKLVNDNFDLVTHFQASQLMAINAVGEVDCSKPLYLGVRFTKDAQGNFVFAPQGNYTLELKSFGSRFADFNIVLKDAFTGENQSISSTTAYNFAITSDPASYSLTRFQLVFTEIGPKLDLNIVAPDKICGDEQVAVTINDSNDKFRYFIYTGDASITDSIAGTGGDLALSIKGTSLQKGLNVLNLQVQGVCKIYSATTPIEITREQASISAELGDILSSNYDEGNQWYFNDQLMVGATAKTHQALQSGKYVLKVTTKGCDTYDTLDYTITSLEDKVKDLIQYFPNPVKDKLNIIVPNSMQVEAINLIDSRGQVVYKITSKIKEEFVIPMDQLATGVYILNVRAAGRYYYYKLLKE